MIKRLVAGFLVLFVFCSCASKTTKQNRSIASDEKQDTSCSKILDGLSDVELKIIKFDNQQVAIKHITKKLGDGSQILLKKVWNDFNQSNEIVFGVNHGHAYLVANGYRVDGYPFGIIKASRSTLVYNSGYLFRIQNVPEEQMNLIKNYLSNNQKHFATSCIGYACKVLHKAGIEIKGPKFTPVLKLKGLFTRGFVDKNGKPLQYDIYQLGTEELHPSENVKAFSSYEQSYLFLGAMVIMFVGFDIYIFVHDNTK